MHCIESDARKGEISTIFACLAYSSMELFAHYRLFRSMYIAMIGRMRAQVKS